MELLDRYLSAVKKHLPRQRQDDIIAELRANLESQLEDKEAELGRPLTADEAAAWLKRLGAPMQVAARYQPQQYLIGPGLFPIYWYVLRMALGWALTIYLFVSGVELVAEAKNVSDEVAAIFGVPGVLFSVAAWVTLVFAAIEFSVARGLVKLPPGAGSRIDWNPCALPPVETLAAGVKKQRTFARAAGEVIFGFLGLIWLLLIRHHPFLIFGPGVFYLDTLPYQWAPVWIQCYWCVVALSLIQLTWNSANLWRGAWRGPRLVYKTVTGVLGLIPSGLFIAVKDHAYVLLKDPAAAQASDFATLNTINLSTYRVVLLIFVFGVLQLIWEIRLLHRLPLISSNGRAER